MPIELIVLIIVSFVIAIGFLLFLSRFNASLNDQTHWEKDFRAKERVKDLEQRIRDADPVVRFFKEREERDKQDPYWWLK